MAEDKRIPGMPPTRPNIGSVTLRGARVAGPLGERTITPDKISAMGALASAAKEAADAANVEPPPIPEEKKTEQPPDPVLEELDKDGLYEDIEQRIRQGTTGSYDIELIAALAFMDSKKRRKIIESKIKEPLSFSDYVMRGEYRQVVPIWGDDAPVAEFRSLTSGDQLAIRHFIAGGDFGGLPVVVEAAQPMLVVACGLVRIGDDRVMPELPRNVHGEERRALIRRRMEWVLEKPYDIIMDLYANYLWFQARIRLAQYGSNGPFRRVDKE